MNVVYASKKIKMCKHRAILGLEPRGDGDKRC